MTARSKGKRQQNRKLKNEKNQLRKLKRLQKTGEELMEICSEVVDEKKIKEIKQKKLEETIKEEFVEEQREIIENKSAKKSKKKVKAVNDSTGIVHEYDKNTMRCVCHGSYPPWYNVKGQKKKANKKKGVLKRNQFRNGNLHF